MHLVTRHLPLALTGLIATAMLYYGPITQPAHYHEFADQRGWLGLPHAANVLSNVGFALVGLWGWLALRNRRHHPALAVSWRAYRVFCAALILTALGSAYYHLAPDDARLVWDRLPIALVCASLLVAVRGDVRGGKHTGWLVILCVAAALSVWWWQYTGSGVVGDLRPYLLLQIMPLVLIPLWQWLHQAPRKDRQAFGAACALYVLAKAAEAADQHLFVSLAGLSGHSIKHLLATAGAALIVYRLTQRVAQTSFQRATQPSEVEQNKQSQPISRVL